MNSKFSPIGYAIILILFIAFVMIVSSPMVVRNYKDTNSKPNESVSKKHTGFSNPESDYIEEDNRRYTNNRSEIADVERRLNDRISDIERRADENRMYTQQISDKYICSIEGGLNENGVVVPIDPENPPAKFVFACEYKK